MLADPLHEHFRIAEDAGLLEVRYANSHRAAQVVRLTNAGHDFLEESRPQTRWEKAKELVTEQGLPLTINTVKAALDYPIKKGIDHLSGKL